MPILLNRDVLHINEVQNPSKLFIPSLFPTPIKDLATSLNQTGIITQFSFLHNEPRRLNRMTRVKHPAIKMINNFSFLSNVLQYTTQFGSKMISSNLLNATVNPMFRFLKTNRIAKFLCRCNCNHWKANALHWTNISVFGFNSLRVYVMANETIKCFLCHFRIMFLARGLKKFPVGD